MACYPRLPASLLRARTVRAAAAATGTSVQTSATTSIRATVAAGAAASVLGAVMALFLPMVAAHADTPWGSTGASYRSGVVCALPDGRRVALASWVVDGAPAFSTADVVARGSSYGPAPSTGASSDLTSGARGLDAGELAELAYLIGHAGVGSPAQVAETSALVAAAFGGGATQQQCLGSQGTSAVAAAALQSAARRFAGPYTVEVSAVRGRPGSAAPVTAMVRSATGVPTPGIAVSFVAGGVTGTALTDAGGRADARLTVPQDASTLTATVAEPTGLRLIASHPASVALGAATPVVSRAPIVAVLHPTPTLSVTGGTALVLSGGTLHPTAGVAGSYGYSGTGMAAVVGPVRPPASGGCSAASYAGAATVWTGTFAFTGDGALAIGSTGALRPGCYAFTGTITTTDSTPAVTAAAAADPANAIGVSAVQITQTVGTGLARAGTLGATVTATGAAGASVTSTVTTYGPLRAASGGQCGSGLTWTRAKVVSRSPVVTLAAQGTDRLTAVVRSPEVTSAGCYALVARSTVTQDGRRAVVSATSGDAGTTVLVIAPTVRIINSSYDGRQGMPMAGTVQVTGTLGLAGRVAIGLVSAPAPATGCHQLTFSTQAATAALASDTTDVVTGGDGAVNFRTPVPGQNRCYGVVATLAMTLDPSVRADALTPGDSAIFLAGAVPPAAAQIDVHAVPASRPTREIVVFGVTGAVVLAIAAALMITAAVAGERRPDPVAEQLLVEIIDEQRELAGV